MKARWVLKPPYLRRSSSIAAATPHTSTFASANDDRKFTFSTISPDTRRHPIIATMTRTSIDVMNSYTMPAATSPPTPGHASPILSSPTLSRSSVDLQSIVDTPSHPSPITTDEALRKFILVSGIWVAANNYVPIEHPYHQTMFKSTTNRTVSLTHLDSPRSASPASTLDENRRSIHKLFRSGTGSLRRRTSMEVPSSPVSTNTMAKSTPVIKTRERRASTDANLGSMTGSMRKRYGVAFEDQALPETEEERQSKRSLEILRIRELAMPPPIERPSMETSPVDPRPQFTPATVSSPANMPPTSDGPTSPVPPMSPPLSPPLSPPMSPPLPADLLSPSLPRHSNQNRTRKTQSAYNPVTTAGLWDSGVTEGPGLKSRPTSMVVSKERKRKMDKEKGKKGIDDDEIMGLRRKGDWYRYKIKASLKGLFRREKM